MVTKISLKHILFLCLYLLFYSRFLTYFGLPSIINFLHYLVLIICALLYFKTKDSNKIKMFLLVLFVLIFLSALINKISLFNGILEFVLISQPVIFYYILNYTADNKKTIKYLERFIIIFSILNYIFMFYQSVVLNYYVDYVRGILLDLGMASHVNGAFAIFNIIIISSLNISKIKKITLYFLQFLVLLWVDNKQSVLFLMFALFIYTLLNLKSINKTIKMFFISVSFIIIIYIAANTVMVAFLSWASIPKVMAGIGAKMSIFKHIVSCYSSPYNFFIGLGPGVTVGRLAQLLPDYQILNNWINITISPISQKLWLIQQTNYYTNQTTGSSIWSMYFSFSGIFGDLGIIGVIVILREYVKMYKGLRDPKSKIILLSCIVHGLFFQWWEEPIFMVYALIIIFLIENKMNQIKNDS